MNTFRKFANFIAIFYLIPQLVFAAPAPPAPAILAGSWFVDGRTENSAVVHFKTDVDSQGSVQYCSDPAVPGSCRFASEPAGVLTMSHTVFLSGLLSDHLYYYQLLASYDESPIGYYPPSGAPINNWPTFRTLEGADRTPPVISNVRASAGATTAMVEFETNEEGTTGAMYCPSPAPPGVECFEAPGPEGVYVRFHSLALTGLTPGTLYYYFPYSADRAGNGDFYRHDPQPSFRTSDAAPAPAPAPGGGVPPPAGVGGGGGGAGGDRTPPVISDIDVDVGTNVIISWKTNELSNSIVDFGLTASYTLSAGSGTLVLNHKVTLTPTHLDPNTLYHYRVRSEDQFGNMAASSDRTFRTLAEERPAVSGSGTTTGTSTGTGTATNSGDSSGTTARPGATARPAVSSSPAQNEEVPETAIQPFSEAASFPPEQQSKFPIHAFLFVVAGLVLMYVLANGEKKGGLMLS